MLRRLPIIALAAIFVATLPVLEIGDTHLVHPDWPGHARLHEAWQLLSNAMLAIVCVWLAFFAGQQRIASIIGFAMTAPFLVAVALQGLYGGSLSHVPTGEVGLSGYIAVPLMAIIAAGLLVTFARTPSPEP